jgi:CRISPR system Cascade subunit CasE
VIAPADEARGEEQATGELWLSRLVLNPRSQEARRDLRDCAAMHRRLCALFVPPAGTGWRAVRDEFDLLHRVEAPDAPTDPATRSYVLLQASKRPNWAALPAHYALEAESKSIGPGAFATGTELRFRLRANPTHTPGRSARQAGRRRAGIRSPEASLAWLRGQGDARGFEVRAAVVLPEEPVRGRRPDGAWMTFTSHLFDGRIRVTNPTKLQQAIADGVGRGLPYGFGLLSLSSR